MEDELILRKSAAISAYASLFDKTQQEGLKPFAAVFGFNLGDRDRNGGKIKIQFKKDLTRDRAFERPITNTRRNRSSKPSTAGSSASSNTSPTRFRAQTASGWNDYKHVTCRAAASQSAALHAFNQRYSPYGPYNGNEFHPAGILTLKFKKKL